MGVGGFFVKGLASGFLQGQQIQEMNWQRKEKERIKKEEDALMETLTMAGKKFSSYYADYNVSEDERLQVIATWSALSYEAKELLKGAYDGVMNYNKEQEEQTLATVKAYRETLEGIDFDLSTIPEISDYFRGQIKSPNGLKYFDAADRILQKNREALQKKKVESFPSLDELYKKHPGAEGEYSATEKGYIVKPTVTKELSAADKKYNWAIEHHALPEGSPGKISDEQLFKFMGVDVSDPEKRNTIQQRLDEMDKLGATTEEKKNYLLGRTPEKPTPEGEITAGEKRTWDMASLVMFGSSDFVTGITKPGIIPTMISNKLNMGNPLTDEEKTEVRNNYNSIKETLPGEVISVVESQLKRYGIPLVEPIKEPTPTPEPEPKKWWEFWKGEAPTGTPTKTTPITPEVTPKAGGIPTPKVPTEGKEAMIPLMSKKELEEAIKGLDPSDPLYKLIYDEAVKRGYITK